MQGDVKAHSPRAVLSASDARAMPREGGIGQHRRGTDKGPSERVIAGSHTHVVLAGVAGRRVVSCACLHSL